MFFQDLYIEIHCSSWNHRLEELSEQLCGHSLKLRCLEGLWRESGCPDHDKLAAESSECGDPSKEGISSASNKSVNTR